MDTYQALILVHLTFNLPYTIWMMRSFFMEVPREIEESALVDGASPLAGLLAGRYAAGDCRALIATGVFCFIFSWSEFFFGLTLTNTRAVPLSVFLPDLFRQEDDHVGRSWRAVGNGDAAAVRVEPARAALPGAWADL